MNSPKPEAARLAELAAALDTYGADRTRWPAPLRHALSGLIAASAEAQRMLQDAEDFDRLLDEAPAASPDEVARLADRIVAAAERQPRVVSSRPDAPVRQRRSISGQNRWAAAALAASLVLGIVAGQSRTIAPAADLLIGASDQSAASSQLALIDETDRLLDEDLL